MAIPTQIGFYERQPSGWFIDMRDGTGPYKTDDGVTFAMAGSGGGGGGDPGQFAFNDAANSGLLILLEDI